MPDPITVALLLIVAAAALVVGGVYLIAGPGYACIIAGFILGVLARIIVRGDMTRGRPNGG